MRAFLALACAVTAALVATASAAAGAVSVTTHWKDVPFTAPDVDCSGDPVTLMGVTSGVEHVTFLDSGGIHATFTEVVTFTATRGTETFTGRWTAWGGFNLNAKNVATTFTFNATGTSDAGTKLRLRIVEHFSMSATGVVHEFVKFSCVD